MEKHLRSEETQTATARDELPAKLSNPARRALAREGITRLEQLTTRTEADIARLHGMGPKTMDQLRAALAAAGQSFADSGK